MRQPFAASKGTVLVLLLVFLGLAGCEQRDPPAGSGNAARDQAPAETCRLTMGWDPWEPYQYRNVQAEVTGLDVDIARAAAAAAGCELEFVEGRWTDLLAQLKDGEIHLLAGATPTPGREAFAVFTAPYRSESFLVYTRVGNERSSGIQSLEDLAASDLRIGVVAEYYYGDELSALLDEVAAAGRLREADVAELNYARLQTGEIDVLIDDPFVAARIVRTRGFGDITPTEIRVDAADVSFMLSRKGVPSDVVERFSKGLEQVRDNGGLEEILHAYRR